MHSVHLKQFYEDDALRFWDPRDGMRGRDLTIYPLLEGLSGSVLEYGAGSGSLLLSLALEQRFTSLTGVDISEGALKNIADAWNDMSQTRGVANGKLTLTTPVNDTLPMVQDNSVDLILSLDTIEHVLNPYIVLDEFYRIGSRDSTFVISVPNYGYIKYVVQLLLGKQPLTGSGRPVDEWRKEGWDGWHLHTFTRQSLDILLRDCGWQPVLWTGYGDKGKQFGLDILRQRFPAVWSGALTVVCKRKP
ncbi:hypothetical protein FGKAn22_23430 [Ferrigenium kumadai]|uniref:Uncharacterized protein n=1 Tax=Ferrigenium kumadai TaxID=1682490 RepID=A0AAN1T1W6_9PROT|nr:class I SAM-dependent methyltransferase [Ferrigenium kumadai]BBJ00651.1 hypothetical protein FGKAn22_23430 [Ferrigenium kumadai]